ncbi:MAG: Spx/MgsR family RNA polymerase-binding regulatory protein [Candidatus Acidiferrales bacterium]|jgi:Spx/MgsR family transcriptional regulator
MATTARKTARRTAKPGKKVLFMQKPTCTTCRKAKKFMQRRGFQLYFRDLAKDRLSAAELEKLIGRRDYTDFLNTRNELFREKDMKENPPSRKEAIRLMAKQPNLIRRPVIVAGGRVVVGFDEDGIAKL